MNIFTNPTVALNRALKRNSILESLVTAIVAGILFGAAIFLQINNVLVIGVNIISMVVQWALICLLFWAFHIMFKEKKVRELKFGQVASAIGELWIIMIAIGVAWLAISFLVNPATLGVAVIIFFLSLILTMMFFFYSYKLIKILVGQQKSRAIIAWLLVMILNALIFVLLQQIALVIF